MDKKKAMLALGAVGLMGMINDETLTEDGTHDIAINIVRQERERADFFRAETPNKAGQSSSGYTMNNKRKKSRAKSKAARKARRKHR